MKIMRYAVVLGVSLSLALTACSAPQASPAPPPAPTTVTDNVIVDPPPAPDATQIANVKALTVGQSTTLGTAIVTRTTKGLTVAPTEAVTVASGSFCGIALAAAIIGIGAGTLGVIAAMTGGAGTVVIAGFLLTGSEVGMLAGLTGSYGAVLGYVSRYIC